MVVAVVVVAVVLVVVNVFYANYPFQLGIVIDLVRLHVQHFHELRLSVDLDSKCWKMVVQSRMLMTRILRMTKMSASTSVADRTLMMLTNASSDVVRIPPTARPRLSMASLTTCWSQMGGQVAEQMVEQMTEMSF